MDEKTEQKKQMEEKEEETVREVANRRTGGQTEFTYQ